MKNAFLLLYSISMNDPPSALASTLTSASTSTASVTAPLTSASTLNYHDRPTFYLDNHRGKPLRAGGVLFYRRYNGEMEVLLIKNGEDRYEDIGGKTDAADGSIYDTIARETWEETNKKISAQVVKRQLQTLQPGMSIYTRQSKYLMLIVRANSYECRLTSDDFGPMELHDQFARTVHWVPVKDLEGLILHPRLNLAAIRQALIIIQIN